MMMYFIEWDRATYSIIIRQKKSLSLSKGRKAKKGKTNNIIDNLIVFKPVRISNDLKVFYTV